LDVLSIASAALSRPEYRGAGMPAPVNNALFRCSK
jgi:hypothetical protein